MKPSILLVTPQERCDENIPQTTGMGAGFRGRWYCVSLVHGRRSGKRGVTPPERCDENIPQTTGMGAGFQGRWYCVSLVHGRRSGKRDVTPRERCDEKDCEGSMAKRACRWRKIILHFILPVFPALRAGDRPHADFHLTH